jgi:hypothetical protein
VRQCGQKAGCRVLAKAGCHPKTRQDVAVHVSVHKNTVSLLSLTLPGCRQAACDRPAQRRSIRWSGRRGSNPRQPAWKAGGRKITACLAQTAATGCLTGALSFSRTHDKSFHMLISCLPTKVFTWCEGRFPRGLALILMISFSWRESKFHERVHKVAYKRYEHFQGLTFCI